MTAGTPFLLGLTALGWASHAAAAVLVSNATFDDWSLADCPSGQFSGFNLSGDQFESNDFSGSDFSGADFSSAFGAFVDFSDCDCSGAFFSYSILISSDIGGADFSNADLLDADFSYATTSNSVNPLIMDGVMADGLNLEAALLDGCPFSAVGGSFVGARLSAVYFSGFGDDFSDADFSSADLSDVQAFSAEIGGANFTNATLSGADFNSARAFNSANPVVFDGAVADGMSLEGAILQSGPFSAVDASFVGANLSGAMFSGLGDDWSGADFSSADLSLVVTYGTEIGGTDFTDADLSGADLSFATTATRVSPVIFDGATANGLSLSGTDFSAGFSAIDASFVGAQLDMIDFDGAVVSGANFKGANLANSTHLDLATFTTPPTYSSQTDFQGTGFDPVAAGWRLVDVTRDAVPSLEFLEGPSRDVQLTIKTETGCSYTLRTTRDFVDVETVGTPSMPGTGGVITVVHTGGALVPSRFYFVLIEVN